MPQMKQGNHRIDRDLIPLPSQSTLDLVESKLTIQRPTFDFSGNARFIFVWVLELICDFLGELLRLLLRAAALPAFPTT